ncbi:wax ester/triacylglycerol synthase family O-acyltransferase, partial [Paraglaciecola sp.]
MQKKRFAGAWYCVSYLMWHITGVKYVKADWESIMRKLSVTDIGFLLMEKRETPMHVGGLNLYSYPEGVDKQAFLASLSNILRDEAPLRPPFGHTLKTGRAGLLGATYWKPDEQLDLDYHVRHSALPQPG